MKTLEKPIMHDCRFLAHSAGSTYKAMHTLYSHLWGGLNCAVATLYPERTVAEFELATGLHLCLFPTAVRSIYEAALSQKL